MQKAESVQCENNRKMGWYSVSRDPVSPKALHYDQIKMSQFRSSIRSSKLQLIFFWAAFRSFSRVDISLFSASMWESFGAQDVVLQVQRVRFLSYPTNSRVCVYSESPNAALSETLLSAGRIRRRKIFRACSAYPSSILLFRLFELVTTAFVHSLHQVQGRFSLDLPILRCTIPFL